MRNNRRSRLPVVPRPTGKVAAETKASQLSPRRRLLGFECLKEDHDRRRKLRSAQKSSRMSRGYAGMRGDVRRFPEMRANGSCINHLALSEA
jgi:hypothetical protein